MNRSTSLVAAERPKVPKSGQEFFNLPDRILLHGEISVGEISSRRNCCWGSCDWGNDLTPKYTL